MKIKLFLSGLLIAIVCSSLFYIYKQYTMEEKFQWSATVSAPREYPIRVLSGFIMSDNYSQGLDFGICNAGWGYANRKNAGSGKKELPDSLMVLWLSFAEKKFYRGEFELPREKIRHYMKEGFMSESRDGPVKDTYETFVVGLAPEGRVAVWLADGGQTRQVELARFQAREETGLDYRNVPEDHRHIFRPDYIPSVMNNEMIIKPEIKERIASHGYPPPEVYDSYAKRYPWTPEIRLPAGSKVTWNFMEMCNGENEFSLTDTMTLKEQRAIPYVFRIHWENQAGKDFGTWIVFSKDSLYWKKFSKGGHDYLPLDFAESEIRKVFLQDIKEDITFKLVLDIYSSQNGVKIFLEQEERIFPINEFVD